MTASRGKQAAGLLLTCMLAVDGFVAWSWPLARNMSSHTLVTRLEPVPAAFAASQSDWNLILSNDQNLSMWGAVENARSMTSGNWRRLLREGQCWPMPDSTALGEHMIELGALASPWWLATHDPIASYNLMFATALLVAAAGMFLFLYGHTASIAASVVGALAFAFATPRLVDLPYHPAVVGTHWIPWVLWSFDRVLARGGAGVLVLFGASLLLAGLVGSYPLIALALVGGAYGAATVLVRWRRDELQPSTLAWCVAAALPALGIVGALLATYARTHHDWMLVPNTGGKFVVSMRDYLPGGLMSVGAVSLAGLVPLVLLRRGPGARAVPGLLFAGAMGLVVATAVTQPGGQSWGLFELLSDRVALLDAVRAPGKVGLAVCLAVQALGAIGWSCLFARVGAPLRVVLASLLIAVVAAEAVPPPSLRSVLGAGAPMELRPAASPQKRVETFAAALAGDDRPVLDLPLGRMVKAPLQLLDATYHGHETSACYNSLVPPTMRAAYALSAHGHSARGVAELSAAGFGFVIERALSPTRRPDRNGYPPPARLLAFEENFAIWGLPPSQPVHHDVAKLSLRVRGGATRTALFAPDPPSELDIDVTNTAELMWALADPPVPLLADVELVSADGSVTMKTRARGVLPLALAAGQTTTIQLVTFEAPPAGDYQATVTLDGIGPIPAPPAFRWSAR